jgi:hypothetical protein
MKRAWAALLLCAPLVAPRVSSAQEEPREESPERPAPRDAPAAEEPEEAPAQTEPRYLRAIQSELEAMRVRGARCEANDTQRAHCTFNARGITTAREFTVEIIYSDRTDTVYIYVERFLVAPPDGQTTPALLRRLMELNWALLLGKFEWDGADGEVRLAMVLNTDSNFDRRAFRGAIRGIGQLADRYWGELDRVLRGQADEPG